MNYGLYLLPLFDLVLVAVTLPGLLAGFPNHESIFLTYILDLRYIYV